MTTTLIGKPMMWTTTVYGKIAVHVTGISPNGRVAILTIDGGEASTPAQRFPELSDGIGFAILGDLTRRTRTLKATGPKGNAVRELAIQAGLVSTEGASPKLAATLRRGKRRAQELNNGEVTF